MAIIASYINRFISLLLILILHLGCFAFTSFNNNKNATSTDTAAAATTPEFLRRKRKPSYTSLSSFKPSKVISTSWSFLKRALSSSSLRQGNDTTTVIRPGSSSPTLSRASTQSVAAVQTDSIISNPPRKRRFVSTRVGSADYSLLDNPFFPLRNDIYPCPICGEVFPKSQLLEQHQSIKHAVTELYDGDSGKNIVWIIFNSGWVDKQGMLNPKIHRILKIQNSSKILSRFEEYREMVKSKASRSAGGRGEGGNLLRRNERCIADGNELLRFHCTTFICNLGYNGNSSLCNQQYCSVCGIIRSGFSTKLDGISTLSTSWRAHASIPDDVEEEFGFMNVKRAMLVCRVIAGRIACDPMVVHKDDPGFDSIVGAGSASGGGCKVGEEDELLVFNPRAVLPCFVIVYSV